MVVLLIFFSFLIQLSNSKVCIGTSNLGSVPSTNYDYVYETMKKRYTNCTRIDGNLELTYMDSKRDWSFLSSIEEITGYLYIEKCLFTFIPLENLRLIRGETLFPLQIFSSRLPSNNLSIGIFDNQNLKSLGLWSLVEILNGGVYVTKNPQLSFNLLWSDIFVSTNFSVTVKKNKDKSCSDNCNAHKLERYCWGPGVHECQNFTKVMCEEKCANRCFDNLCCQATCAGGCFGNSRKDCFACKFFNDKDECVEQCPPPEIYDPNKFKYVPNPNGKFSYGHFCVEQCPGNMYQFKSACVKACPENFMPSGTKCIPCQGLCPKRCNPFGDATYPDWLTHHNAPYLNGCTILDGSLHIYGTSFKKENQQEALVEEDLKYLNNLTLIEHNVYLEGESSFFTNLLFLKNLKTIYVKTPINNNCSLLITETSLETLDLLSLQEIGPGRICIFKNPHLCFGTESNPIKWDIFTQNVKTYIKSNKNKTLCEQEGMVCHNECTDHGCFGPNDDQCVVCKNFKQGNKCVEKCYGDWFFSEVAFASLKKEKDIFNSKRSKLHKYCLHCHSQCKGGCHGTEPNQCLECQNFRDGPFCVEECPGLKFPDSRNNCEPCDVSCGKHGCYGKSDKYGPPDGCRSCDLFVMDKTNFIKEKCILQSLGCPRGYYNYKEKECRVCDEECSYCEGPGASNCNLNFCRHVSLNDKCVSSCPINYYINNQTQFSRCVECHDECERCTGPTSSQCLSCRLYKLYEDIDNRENNPKFQCVSQCPSWAPHKISDEKGEEVSTLCVDDSHAQAYTSKKSKVGFIVGAIVGMILLIFVILAIIFFLKRQITQKKLKQTELKAVIEGFIDTEALKPTDAGPDVAVLDIVDENELRVEKVIGSGAFGTVYKGVYAPRGKDVKMPVAIKIMRVDAKANEKTELLNEARIMASVGHQNCVRLTGICLSEQIKLITPLLPFGSLLSYLRKNKDKIGSKNMLNWANQIAKGMEYLEKRGIVHRDLAARNVLVKNANVVKITDFGLSKLLDVDQEEIVLEDGMMPIKWMAVESIRNRIYTHKSDVWSYGVTVWEIFTYGERPYEEVEARDVLYNLERGQRLSQPKICTLDSYMVLIKCWLLDASCRPSFAQLSQEFSKMAKDPGRFLYIEGDKLKKIPIKNVDIEDMVEDGGPEKLVSAEDYYLHPKTEEEEDDDYLKPKGENKNKINNSSEVENKYTSDPTSKSNKNLRGEDTLDVEINNSDYGPASALLNKQYQKPKGSLTSISDQFQNVASKIKNAYYNDNLNTKDNTSNKIVMNEQKANHQKPYYSVNNEGDKNTNTNKRTALSEYMSMTKAPPANKATLAEFEDDTIDEGIPQIGHLDDYLTEQLYTHNFLNVKNEKA